MKYCSACKETKGLGAFCKNRCMKDGRSNWCRDCKSAHNKRSPAKKAVYSRRFRSVLRAAVIAGYGGRCNCCGETEKNFLTIDHINGGGGLERKTLQSSQLYAKLRSENFPKEKYQLLCFNCNCGKRINGGACPHGEQK